MSHGGIRGAKFTEEEKAALRLKMMQEGFLALKKGGFLAVNIDQITGKCYVAKGTFYHVFESKTEFLYQVMLYKRQEAKDQILAYLDPQQKLSWDGLYAYLHWLAEENPNIFSYLDGQRTRYLISKWPQEYLENEMNDEQTARRIISYLKDPKENANWQLFCNYLKIIALALNSSEYLLAEATETLLDHLIADACNCISCR